MYRNGGSNELNVSAWDDKPFEMLPSGNKAYLDEQDDGFVLHVWLVRKWKGILFCSEKVEEWKGGIRIKKC